MAYNVELMFCASIEPVAFSVAAQVMIEVFEYNQIPKFRLPKVSGKRKFQNSVWLSLNCW